MFTYREERDLRREQLPNDWKDVIDRMVSRERRSTLPTINTVVDFSTHEGPSTDLDGEAEPLRQSPASTVGNGAQRSSQCGNAHIVTDVEDPHV